MDPSTVRSWSIDERLHRWVDHLLIWGERIAFRSDGIQLRLWCAADVGVTETRFAPLIVFDRDRYAALLAAIEAATGMPPT
ncbi:hypothetical protein [Aeromicrobium sp. MLTX1]|uniref:hypothetical protein n=1 Tax=Aeromicrobium sp. MLTX1 TaxID=3389799 RepID=UPI00396B3221